MITQEMNDRLTRVGPGTPMGTLLHRYWDVIAAAGALDEDPVRPVRILGEVAERGDDPMDVVRDRSRNEPFIRIPWEDKAKESFYPDGGRDRGCWARNREEATAI